MARSNYADKPLNSFGGIPEHRLAFNNDARGFTPDAGESDGEGKYGNLAAASISDSAFKSARVYPNDKSFTWSRSMIDAAYPDGHYVPNVRVENQDREAELEAQMPTFRGVPPGAAETHRGQVFTRS